MDKIFEKIKETLGWKKNEKQDPNFYLLPDCPISPDKKEDFKFGHNQLVKTICELLKNAEPPFTIGLYGKWGTGKTSIANLVKESVDKKIFKCLYFDTWKYQRDSLRRQFLIELDKQVFNGILKYKEKLNQSLSSPENLTFWYFLQILLFNFFIIIVVIAILILFSILVFKKNITNYENFLPILKDGSIAGAIISFFLSSFHIIRGSILNHRTDSAEGFENHFIEAVKKLKIDNRLLVIIDNLDRVEDLNAVSILSDIKTFLSQDGVNCKVMFLIPCDDQALRTQLSKIYGKQFDTDEFLRKFFNLTIKIPKFIDIDLFNYIKDLLAVSKVPEFRNSNELIWVINYALRDNPREIKQFINSLTAQILLARERKLDIVIKNSAFLAKLLIIRQKYPILFKIIEEKSLRSQLSINDINELSYLYKNELELHDWEEKNIKIEIEKFEEYNNLTKGINRENLDIFLTLRQSHEEKEIPEWSSLILALEEKHQNDAQKILKKIISEDKIQYLDNLLKSYVNKIKTGSSLNNILSTILPIAEKKDIKLNYFFDAAANHFSFQQNFKQVYDQFEINTVFNFWYPNTTDSIRKKIVYPFVQLLAYENKKESPTMNQEYISKLIDIINTNIEIFEPHFSNLRLYLEQNYSRYPFLNRLDSKAAVKDVISIRAIINYIDSLKKDDFKNNNDLNRALRYLKKINIPEFAVTQSINKFEELFINYKDASEEEKLVLCNNLHYFSNKYSDLLKNENIDEKFILALKKISAVLCDYYDQFSQESKQKIIEIIEFFANIDKNPNQSILEKKIKNYIQESTNESLLKIGDQKLIAWIKRDPEAIILRSQKDPTILLENGIYKILNQTQNQTIVLGLLDNRKDPENLLNKIEYKVENKEKIIDCILDHIPDFKQEIFPGIVKSLMNLGIKQDNTKLENLKNRLRELKNRHLNNEKLIVEIDQQFSEIIEKK